MNQRSRSDRQSKPAQINWLSSRYGSKSKAFDTSTHSEWGQPNYDLMTDNAPSPFDEPSNQGAVAEPNKVSAVLIVMHEKLCVTKSRVSRCSFK